MILLANIVAIFRKELQGYFGSPWAYVVAGVFWLLSGAVFFLVLLGESGIIQEVLYNESLGLPLPPVDMPYVFLLRFLGVLGSITLFVMPLLSMGLYAEERKAHTLELLATSPLTNWTVAIGKLLGVVTFYITLLVPVIILEIITFNAAVPPLPPRVPLVAHFGLILLATAVLSLGMFISSLTSSSIIAALATFVLVIFLTALDMLSRRLEQPFQDAIAHLSLLKHYENLVQGICDSSSIVVFVSYIVLGIFLTAQSIEAFRFERS
ncbi:MAG: ABC transporter permease subunit [Spirulina sp. SIO3F2]|nr:ABC transporter permease subunit [Spirulina sp. SIO3F2]